MILTLEQTQKIILDNKSNHNAKLWNSLVTELYKKQASGFECGIWEYELFESIRYTKSSNPIREIGIRNTLILSESIIFGPLTGAFETKYLKQKRIYFTNS